jgi:hypothetical protein
LDSPYTEYSTCQHSTCERQHINEPQRQRVEVSRWAPWGARARQRQTPARRPADVGRQEALGLTSKQAREGQHATRKTHRDTTTPQQRQVVEATMSAAAVKVSNPMFNPAASPRAEEAEEDGADSSVEQKMAKYEEIFQRYDEDNSGTIESSELQNVMRELGQDMSPDELAAMIKEIDTDGSGEIDFEEFMQAVTGKMSAIFADMNKELEDKIFGSSVGPHLLALHPASSRSARARAPSCPSPN